MFRYPNHDALKAPARERAEAHANWLERAQSPGSGPDTTDRESTRPNESRLLGYSRLLTLRQGGFMLTSRWVSQVIPAADAPLMINVVWHDA